MKELVRQTSRGECDTRFSLFPTTVPLPDKSVITGQVHEILRRRTDIGRRELSKQLRRQNTDESVALQSVLHALVQEPVGKAESVLDSVRTSFVGEEGQKRAQLINIIFRAKHSWKLPRDTEDLNIPTESIPDLLRHEGLHPLIGTMLDKPEQYGMPLGLIFSFNGLEAYPENVTGNFNPRTITSGVSLEPVHRLWFLCDDMEPIMAESKKDNVMAVVGDYKDPLFLVNFRTKMAGLCLQDFRTPDGKVFFRGNLYIPTDEPTRHMLDANNDVDINILPGQQSTWAMMRPIGYKVPSPVPLAEYDRYAKSLTGSYMSPFVTFRGDSMTRAEYRRQFFEDYTPR